MYCTWTLFFFFIDIRLFGVLCLLFFLAFLLLYTEYFTYLYSCTEYKDDT